MPTRRSALTLFAAAVAMTALSLRAGTTVALRIAPMATGLDEPWGLAFLPDGRFLVTERPGRLTLFPSEGGRGRPVEGLPEVAAIGQGGLLDVMVPRDFATSRRVWLSYAEGADGGASTAMGYGALAEDGSRLEGFTRVHNGPATRGGRHFGARIVEAADGTIFLTTGDRGDGTRSQDPARPEGKVLAFAPDGTPRTFPDFGPGAQAGLWSMGHRNIQGAALDGQGRLWTVEHGAQGGDELNRPEPGRNYGWPVISYGRNYNGRPIGEGTARPGMEQPVHYWDPSIAPSGLFIHSGRMFPDWRGHVLTGSLKFDLIARLDPSRGYAETRIEAPETARVRDVREGPDGAVWFLSVGEGAAFRMVPA
jgi:glucose/arabinose dehydrogenase